MLDTYVSADCLPELNRDYAKYMGGNAWERCEFNTRTPSDRDFLARAMARILGMRVGATAPHFFCFVGGSVGCSLVGVSGRRVWFDVAAPGITRTEPDHIVPDLASIPLDSPDRDALALAAVARWLGDEVKAGRVVSHE